jgi:DNA-binding ferritin-like protein
MTDAMTGRIVASVPLQKQIFSREVGASMGRFFGNTLVSLDMGGQQREAVHFALRQMLSFATFELVGQVMNKATFQPCKDLVSEFYGEIRNSGTGDPAVLQQAAQKPQRIAAAAPPQVPSRSDDAASSNQPQPAVRSIEEQVKELANHAMVFGARAVAAAEESLAADSLDVSAQKAAEATELLRGAVQILQRAAELGLSGPEGDAVALVVERGMGIVKQAQDELAERTKTAHGSAHSESEKIAPNNSEVGAGVEIPQRSASPPHPGTAEAQRLGLE